MLSFQHNSYFFALIAIPVLVLLYFYLINWKKNTAKKIGEKRLLAQLIKNFSSKKFAIKFILLINAFVFIVLALANLRMMQGTQKITRNGIDIMIALDVSKSMLAQDIAPSRLERAKQFLNKLIDKLNNNQIGIVVFAGKAYLQMPITSDNGAAKMYLSSVSPDIVPTQGTVIGEALKMCFQSFNTNEKKYKSVIIVSDGEDHDDAATKIASQIANEGVVINAIGVGSLQGSTIIDPTTNEAKKDNDGNTVITKLNEDELKAIAKNGNGIYQLYNNTDEVVNTLVHQLGSMNKRIITDNSLSNYKSFFQYFLSLSLLLLVIEMFISERKNLIKKNKLSTKFFVLLSFALLPFTCFTQTEKAIIKSGNDAYLKNDFNKAIMQYQKVIAKTPTNATAQYNLGNALFKNNKKDEAIIAYNNAAKNLSLNQQKEMAFYNKGVVYQNDKKIPECINAYKEALKLNWQDDDARQNLQKALQEFKQQQQKSKQQQNKNQQKKQTQNDPKPQPSKLTKKDAEEKLKALLQQEKKLQDKLKKTNVAGTQKPDKDW